jgi:hypothetical protein
MTTSTRTWHAPARHRRAVPGGCGRDAVARNSGVPAREVRLEPRLRQLEAEHGSPPRPNGSQRSGGGAPSQRPPTEQRRVRETYIGYDRAVGSPQWRHGARRRRARIGTGLCRGSFASTTSEAAHRWVKPRTARHLGGRTSTMWGGTASLRRGRHWRSRRSARTMRTARGDRGRSSSDTRSSKTLAIGPWPREPTTTRSTSWACLPR